MKGISCFKHTSYSLEQDDAPPRSPRKRDIRRQGSNQSQASRCSTTSNSSISKLPPCKRQSDAEIEAMMMPVPPEGRESRCLRMSRPGIYGDIVHSMKQSRGCRNWKSFDVFHKDDVDMTLSANDVARKRALQYARNLRSLNSFGSARDYRRSIDNVDLIG